MSHAEVVSPCACSCPHQWRSHESQHPSGSDLSCCHHPEATGYQVLFGHQLRNVPAQKPATTSTMEPAMKEALSVVRDGGERLSAADPQTPIAWGAPGCAGQARHLPESRVEPWGPGHAVPSLAVEAHGEAPHGRGLCVACRLLQQGQGM